MVAQPQTGRPQPGCLISHAIFDPHNFMGAAHPIFCASQGLDRLVTLLSLGPVLHFSSGLRCLTHSSLLPVSTPPMTTFISVATSDRRRGTVPTVWRDSWSDVDTLWFILALNVWFWATSVLASACDDECLTNHALTINHWMNRDASWSPVLSAARHGRFMPGQPSMQIAAHTQTYNRCCQGPGVGGPKPRCSTSMPSPSALSAGLTCYHGLYIGRQLSQPMD